MMPVSPRRLILAGLLLWPAALHADKDPSKDTFVREDWIATVEPNRLTEWGDQWAVNNFLLPYRALQTAKHRLETRYLGNYRFSSEDGGAGGMFLRFSAGTMLDFGAFMGIQNIHHQTGHDAAAREFDREFGDGKDVPRRFQQVLPRFLGGRPLGTMERQPNLRGADANSRANVQPMESENTFAYAAGKDLLAADRANATAVERYLFERGRFFWDYTETGVLSQDFLNARANGGNDSGAPLSTDFTQYLYCINTDRYGVTKVSDFRLKMGDIKQAYFIQLADPLMWSALYVYGHDYIVKGANTTHLPMIPLAEDWGYIPSLRVFFSPFGIEYFQDNYIRHRGVLTNIYWTTGDNSYERRVGGGLNVQNIPLPRHGKFEVFASVHQQPVLSRIADSSGGMGHPLTSSEMGRTHIAYNVGGSIEIPVWIFDKTGEDPRRLFLYSRGGTKNLSWFPGDYFAGGLYIQTGLGVRL